MTNTLGVPVISIDYRLAPENQYPNALDDVYQAYNCIVNYAAEELGINVNKIILAGDSAGGNLALSLTYLLILHGKRVPNGLMLAYPALRNTIENLSPSYFLTLHDQILPFHLIKFCHDSYLGNYTKGEIDPFVNPGIMKDNLIKFLPPVRIVAGTSDPL